MDVVYRFTVWSITLPDSVFYILHLHMLPYQLLHFTPTLCCKKVWISEFPPSCISCRWKVCYFCLVICGAQSWAETGNSEGVRYRETCKLYINIGPDTPRQQLQGHYITSTLHDDPWPHKYTAINVPSLF